MELIGKKRIVLQDAGLKIVPNKSNETSIFLNQDLGDKLGLATLNSFEFQIDKENVLKAICFAFSFSKKLYKDHEIIKLNQDWYYKQLDKLNKFFEQVQTKKYTVGVTKASQNRWYFNGFSEKNDKFNIRSFLIENHTIIEFYKKDDNSWVGLFENTYAEFDVLDSPTLDYQTELHPLNQILYGSAGTGKTFNSMSHAVAITQNLELEKVKNELSRNEVKGIYNQLLSEGQIGFITFHQSYSYEEFIEGIKAETTDDGNVAYHIRDGIFKKMCAFAAVNPTKNFVLVIDEINRGNISRIFGELITLIEDSKRIGKDEALQVRLAYSSSTDDAPLFGVPQNVYLVGTMNTADRSITLIDTALRRRFTFIEYPAQPTLLPPKLDDAEIDLCQLLTVINQRIEFLLDKDHQIGHANFWEVKTKASLCDVFKNKLIPLLEEYFYNDWEKIQMVLGDNSEWKGKTDDLKLIVKNSLSPTSIFGTETDSLEGKVLYRIKPDLLNKNYDNIQAAVFTSIYKQSN